MTFIESTIEILLDEFDFTFNYLEEDEKLEIILSCELIFGIELPENIDTKIELLILINTKISYAKNYRNDRISKLNYLA